MIKRYHIFSLLVFLFFSSSIKASFLSVEYAYIDSLKAKLEDASDLIRVDLFNKIAYNYYYIDNDSTLKYAEKALQLAQSIKYLEGLSEAQRLVGIGYKAENQNAEAFRWLYKGLQTAESVNYHQGIADNLNSLGIFHDYVDNQREALELLKRSLHHQKLAGNRLRQGLASTNIGRIFLEMHQMDSAQIFFENARVILDSIGNPNWLAMLYSQYAGYYIEAGDLQIAERFSVRSLNLSKAHEQVFHLRKSYQNMAEIYLLQNKLSSAEKMALQSLEASIEIGFIPYITDAYEVLYKINKQQQDLSNALVYHEKYVHYMDSFQLTRRNSELNLLGYKQELEEKEKENLKLRKEKQVQEIQNTESQSIIKRQALIGLAILLALVTVSIQAYIYYRLRNKEKVANDKLLETNQKLETQKEVLSNSLEKIEDLNAQLRAQNRTLNKSAIVCITNLQGDLIEVNENFCQVSGLSREEAIGQNVRILNSGRHNDDFFKEMWKVIRRGKTWRGELLNKKVNGDYYWCDTAISAINDDHGEPVKFFALQFEITDRKKYLNELAEKSKELEQLNNMKDKLFSVVSHDFRSPLNSLKGTLNLLMKGLLTEEEFRKISADLMVKLDHTYNMLENLLKWSRSQMDGFKVSPGSHNMASITNDCMNLLSPIASKKSIQIVNNVERELEVFADHEMCKLILRNLVSNAIKFSNKSSEIVIGAEKVDQKIVVSVEDKGTGISGDNQEKIFHHENFSTVGTSKEKGMGIGLMLCKEFVEKNGGAIWYESQLDKGSTFFFSLPASKKPVSEFQS